MSSGSRKKRAGKKAKGPPRLDHYTKLISRFYEPLILLLALGSVRGDHTTKFRDKSKQGMRHQFLNDLAFLCEYEKGGDSCSAIAIEDRPECLVYWVAANVDPQGKIAPFLESVLMELKIMLDLPSHQIQEKTDLFRANAMRYSRPKISELCKLMRRNIIKCKRRLQQERSPENIQLENWLDTINEISDLPSLCHEAYESRKSDYMRQLDRLGRDPAYADDSGKARSPFAEVRHYIGRLAAHIRVSDRVITVLPDIRDLFRHEYRVEAVPICPSVPQPQADGQTTLDGICNRIFGTGSSADPRIWDALLDMDRTLQIMDRFRKEYEDENFQPRVHAEIQVLEHFYSRDLYWLEDDRFVGCTKDACFCCQLYFRHHPAVPVEPQSHRKVYRNWGPPLLPAGAEDPNYPHQLKILNRVIEEVRKDALQQVRQRRGPRHFHADSRTGITSTTPGPGGGGSIADITRAVEGLEPHRSSASLSSLSTADSTTPSPASLSGSSPGSSSLGSNAPSRLVEENAEPSEEGGAEGFGQ